MALDSPFEGVLAAARGGAEWAWEAIYRQLSPSVLGYLRGRGPPPSNRRAPREGRPAHVEVGQGHRCKRPFGPSASRADIGRMHPTTKPLAGAEFLAVDVETNGRGGEECELTEIGAVLVGGGELHECWESLVRVERPLSRGIERLTGITQAMVDTAPPPEEVLPELASRLEDRVLVAHNASFDSRALQQAFDRAGLDWPEPPVLCTLALARRFAPLTRERKLAQLASALGVEVDGVHRGLPDATTCARVFCAMFPRLCAHAQTVEEATRLAEPGRRRRANRRRRAARRPPEERPDLSALPDDPGVYIFRDERGRPLYVGKSVAVKTRARSHFCTPSSWTERAEIVDYKPTNSELGALVLENRLIKRFKPAGNVRLKRTDGYVYLRCRLDIAYPVLEVAPEPAPGQAINVGPLRGRRAARELADQLNTLFRLRHCGRSMARRDHPSIYGQMGYCVSPCLGDLDPNAYRRLLDEALALLERPDASARLLDWVEQRMRAAAAERRYERAAVLRRRHARLEAVLGRLSGILRATHVDGRVALVAHPTKKDRVDAFWIVRGRLVEWGPVETRDALMAEARAALEALGRSRPRPVAPEEVDEVRLVSTWLAEHEPPQRELGPEDAPGLVAGWALHAAG